MAHRPNILTIYLPVLRGTFLKVCLEVFRKAKVKPKNILDEKPIPKSTSIYVFFNYLTTNAYCFHDVCCN